MKRVVYRGAESYVPTGYSVKDRALSATTLQSSPARSSIILCHPAVQAPGIVDVLTVCHYSMIIELIAGLVLLIFHLGSDRSVVPGINQCSIETLAIVMCSPTGFYD